MRLVEVRELARTLTDYVYRYIDIYTHTKLLGLNLIICLVPEGCNGIFDIKVSESLETGVICNEEGI